MYYAGERSEAYSFALNMASARHAGESFARIAQRHGCSVSTVRRVLSRWAEACWRDNVAADQRDRERIASCAALLG